MSADIADNAREIGKDGAIGYSGDNYFSDAFLFIARSCLAHAIHLALKHAAGKTGFKKKRNSLCY